MKNIIIVFSIILLFFCENNLIYASENDGTDIYTEYMQLIEKSGYSTEKNFNADSISEIVYGVFSSQIKKLVKFFLAILLIHILSSSTSEIASETISEMMKFSCYLICSALICYEFRNITGIIKDGMGNLNKFTNISIPLYIGFLAVNGYASAASSLNSGFAILSVVVSHVFNSIILPVLYYCGILNMINGLTKHVNVSGFINSLKKLVKYSLGIILTFVSGFMAISGFSGIARDNLTIRTARYAISNFVPVVGACLSDTLNSFTNSSIVLKNSMGYTGLISIMLICLAPVIKILLSIFTLKITSSVMQLISVDILTETMESITEILEIMFGLFLILIVIFILIIALIVSIGV